MVHRKYMFILLLLVEMTVLERTSVNSIEENSKDSFDGFEIQALKILRRIQIDAIEYRGIYRALDDMAVVLRTLWPGAKLEPFGSLFTGLGTAKSDLDCFVKLPSAQMLNESSLVEMAATVLQRHPHLFSPIIVKSYAVVPIVRTVHVPTSRDVDINFHGLSNTLLTTYHLHLDDRALKLAIILTYWMRLQQVNGINVPNYITTVLVIFYLQQKNILPSVSELQKNVKPDIINHWNHAFEKMYYRPNNGLKLYELLVGYFEYYASFAFDKYVVSPFVGYPVEIQQFADYKRLPEEFKLYKINVGNNVTQPINLNDSIIIQCPFIHNVNVAVKMSHQVAQKTIAAFKKANTIYHTNHNPDEYLTTLLKI